MKTITKTNNVLCGLISGLLLLTVGTSTSLAAVVESGNVNYISDSENPSNGLGFLDMSFSDALSLSAALAKARVSYPNARLATPSEFDDLFSAAGITYSGSSKASDGFKVGANEQIVANGSIATIVLVGQLGGTIGAGETLIWTDPDGSADLGSTRDIVRIDTFGPSESRGRAFLQHATFQTGIPGTADYAGFLLVIPAPSNAPPTANAGLDQSLRAGGTVTLDGSSSFDDNTAPESLGYSWTFISKPDESTATLTSADTSEASFVADVAGSYVLTLVVIDEQGAFSAPASVTISSDNQAPTAVATVDFGLAIVGTTSAFDGSGSTDPEGDALTYAWVITTAPAGSTAELVGATSAGPALTTDVEGTYELTLTVSDALGAGTPASVEVVATSPGNYAEMQIIRASDAEEALLPGQVTTRGNQTALGNFLKQATKNIQKGNIDKAISDLNHALERTDGCVVRGGPDGNGQGMDWITDCDAQAEAYGLLAAAIAALQL